MDDVNTLYSKKYQFLIGNVRLNYARQFNKRNQYQFLIGNVRPNVAYELGYQVATESINSS